MILDQTNQPDSPTGSVSSNESRYGFNLIRSDSTSSQEEPPANQCKDNESANTLKPLVFSLTGHPIKFRPVGRLDNLETLAVRLPLVGETFLSAINRARVAWVDKTSIIRDAPKAHPWHKSFPVIRRPSGFGKTSALSVFKLFYQNFDKNFGNPAFFNRAFGPTAMGSILDTHPHLHDDAETLVTLSFDLSVLDVSSVDAFIASIHTMLIRETKLFLAVYSHLLYNERTKPTIGIEFFDDDNIDQWDSDLMNLIIPSSSGLRVLLLIDNCDYPQIQSNNDPGIMRALFIHLIIRVRCLQPEIFTRGLILGSADPDFLGKVVTLQRPDPWRSVGCDVSQHPALATAFGLTKEEVSQLCGAVGVPHLAKLVFERFEIHYFCADYDKGVYCTRDVLDFIAEATGKTR